MPVLRNINLYIHAQNNRNNVASALSAPKCALIFLLRPIPVNEYPSLAVPCAQLTICAFLHLDVPSLSTTVDDIFLEVKGTFLPNPHLHALMVQL